MPRNRGHVQSEQKKSIENGHRFQSKRNWITLHRQQQQQTRLNEIYLHSYAFHFPMTFFFALPLSRPFCHWYAHQFIHIIPLYISSSAFFVRFRDFLCACIVRQALTFVYLLWFHVIAKNSHYMRFIHSLSLSLSSSSNTYTHITVFNQHFPFVRIHCNLLKFFLNYSFETSIILRLFAHHDYQFLPPI